MKFLKLIVKNVSRNLLRSVLTAVGTMVLVFVVMLVWSTLGVMSELTKAKSKDFKGLVTERWATPSRMPFAYADSLSRGAARYPGDLQPSDCMTWQFFVGTLDKNTIPARDSIIYAIAVEPVKITTMLEGMDTLTPQQLVDLQKSAERLEANRQGIILGSNHCQATNKRVGERITLYGLGLFRGIDLQDFEIVGVFPSGHYDTLAAFNRDYYNNALDTYPQNNGGRKHPVAERSLNLVWLKFPDHKTFARVATQIESSPLYRNPAPKCETAASGLASFTEGFRDLVWGMQWLLAPACLVALSLVIANAISINVRERRMELAVLKVLGFRPRQVLVLVLGEALLMGAGAGLASATLTYGIVNWAMDGIKFPVGLFNTFFIPVNVFWWGTGVGAATALVGSILPAWSARNTKVADVFSKVA